MFAEQLPANHIPIFRNNPHKTIHIFGMLSHQL
jgi:hypothetical protein